MESNVVNWFEIPATDLDRGMKFYESVFGYKLDKNDMGEGFLMAWFPYDAQNPGSAGALVHHETYKPNAEGTTVYFTSPSGDLNNELSKVEENGGKVIVPKKSIGEYGNIAMFIDSEGNRLGLHSEK